MPARKKRKPAKHKAHVKVKRVARKRRTRRKIAAKSEHRVGIQRKRKPRKRKRSVRRGQRIKVVHVVAGKKKRTRSRSVGTRRRSYPRKKRVVMAGRGRRSRSVGKKGNMGLLMVLGVGALALYFLTRPKTVSYPNLNQLPPLNATANYQRNDQQNTILQYALAASLGIDAITKLIQSLNSSSDDQVRSIYDHVETTGSLPNTVYV
jgi:hypothetical protein